MRTIVVVEVALGIALSACGTTGAAAKTQTKPAPVKDSNGNFPRSHTTHRESDERAELESPAEREE